MDLTLAERALSQQDLPEFRRQIEQLFPRDAEAETTGPLIDWATSHNSESFTGASGTFTDSIATTKRIHAGAPLPGLARLRIGKDLDFLCDQGGIEDWTIGQTVNFLLLGQIKPRRRSVVVTAMRDDGIYILEWVAHYRALGFDHIVIYTNDNSDGSDDLLQILAEHGVITLVENETSGTVPPESKAFGHAIHQLHDFRDFEWALFVDSDEFFVPSPKYLGSIHNLLSAIESRFPERPPSGICYDWLWFVSGMTYKRTSHLLLERFQYARPHHLTKCLARIADLISMRRDHYPEVKPGGLLVDSIFEPIDIATIYNKVPQYLGGRVNHYWARSFEEFAVKKARGASMQIEANLYDRPFTKFFAWNGYESPEDHYPPDPFLVAALREQIEQLKALEGVRTAAALLDLNFSYLVHSIADEPKLRRIYAQSQTPPAAL